MNDAVHILVRAVIIDQGHILLCKSITGKHTFYFLPGGHVEPGEDEQTALCRELKEETGAIFTIGEKLAVIPYQFHPLSFQKYCHHKECNVIYKAYSSEILVAKPLVQWEDHIELEWIPLQQIHQIDVKPEALVDILR